MTEVRWGLVYIGRDRTKELDLFVNNRYKGSVYRRTQYIEAVSSPYTFDGVVKFPIDQWEEAKRYVLTLALLAEAE